MWVQIPSACFDLAAMKPEATQTLFEQYINASDLEGALSLYDKDAVVIQKDGSINRGIVEIRQHLQRLLSLSPRMSVTVNTLTRRGKNCLGIDELVSYWNLEREQNH